ncbi:hypothetical protein JQ609_24485 [Bradyrhizobium sp. AUGA SZCCT0169]|uniref:hypothetical protein n=1 Tax=unclassified Bradyrhizobium TaxID=2631580 RepID=UPI001BA734EA|nr:MULTISPECIES: hypothetical protein [unclassified Bradyrhizobium]MBR1187309.1 hypothetical protein [Bradyrhizobium sp. AUGA SZCCT0160]MBR1250069.1 hypothetical protein [Bradyrhizobium sp. AUGA SZCCT0169]
MFKKTFIVAASLALASSAFAQGSKSPGGSDGTLGNQMQDTTKSRTLGASDAPGHQLQDDANKSKGARGHQTTTGSSTSTKK